MENHHIVTSDMLSPIPNEDSIIPNIAQDEPVFDLSAVSQVSSSSEETEETQLMKISNTSMPYKNAPNLSSLSSMSSSPTISTRTAHNTQTLFNVEHYLHENNMSLRDNLQAMLTHLPEEPNSHSLYYLMEHFGARAPPLRSHDICPIDSNINHQSVVDIDENRSLNRIDTTTTFNADGDGHDDDNIYDSDHNTPNIDEILGSNSTRTSGRMQLFLLFIIGLANAADASEIIAIGFILDLYKKVIPMSSFEEGLIAAAVFAGMLLGGILSGFIGDRLGRRTVLVFAIVLNAISGLLSALSSSVYTLVLCRFIGGLGIGGSMPPVFALAAEIALPSRQGRALSWIAWNWVFGSVYVAGAAWILLGFFELSWRIFAAVAAIPAVFCAILVYLYVPESPQFLISDHRIEESVDIVVKLALQNDYCTKQEAIIVKDIVLQKWIHLHNTTQDQEQQLYQFERHENGIDTGAAIHAGRFHTSINPIDPVDCIDSLQAMDARIDSGINSSTIPYNTEKDNIHETSKSLWSQISVLYSVKITCQSILLLQFTWFILSAGTYGLSVWVPQLFEKVGFDAGKYAETFMYTAAQAPACVMSSLTVDSPSVGPKKLLVVSAVLASLCTGAFLVTELNAFAAVTLVCLYQMFSCACWNALDILATANFPASRRTTAFALQSACGRAGAIGGQFLFSYMVNKNPELTLGFCAIMMIFCAGATQMLPSYDERVDQGVINSLSSPRPLQSPQSKI